MKLTCLYPSSVRETQTRLVSRASAGDPGEEGGEGEKGAGGETERGEGGVIGEGGKGEVA